uniref:Amino acid transporter transmembrane domain-containing protein n=1 Tax=Entomoneis paludosa TaxID=265537 RepID=A0A7S2YPZ0_9STRA|mmetsp:Transcript_5133/g.10863  ORF Transcript_5133/g.10863 Transcript_5133/m.10863 type:complete len:582 (+) Transcript_5133:111-1856(+)
MPRPGIRKPDNENHLLQPSSTTVIQNQRLFASFEATVAHLNMAPRIIPRWFRNFGSSERAQSAPQSDNASKSHGAPVVATEESPLISSHHPNGEDLFSQGPGAGNRYGQSGNSVRFDGDLNGLETSSRDDGDGDFNASIRSITQSIRKIASQISMVVEEHTGSIGYLGSFAIAVNSLTGPAMLELPAAFAESGLIPTTLTLFFVCFLSTSCSLHMANCISKVPVNKTAQEVRTAVIDGGPGGDVHSMQSQAIELPSSGNKGIGSEKTAGTATTMMYNHDFKAEVEFSAVFAYYWGYQPWYFITQLLFWICITCLNISSIVDTAQVVDTILGHSTGSVAVQVRNGHNLHVVFWDAKRCSQDDLEGGTCLPFSAILGNEDGGFLFTIGMLVTTICFLPLALMDLKENAQSQIVAYIVLLLTSLQFIIQFAMEIFLSPVDSSAFPNPSNNTIEDATDYWYSEESLWGRSWDNLFGIVLFNFALVIAVPAWLYEREPHVDVPTVVYGSSFLATFLYIVIGWLGRLAVPHVASNFLASLMSGVYGAYMQFGACLFAFFIVGLGIPLFSVLTRLNLIGCSGNQPAIC